MIVALLILNTVALLLSLKVDLGRLEKVSDLSILLLIIWIFETVLSKFYGIFFLNNIVLYNIFTHLLIGINFYVFRRGTISQYYIIPILWIIISFIVNLIYLDDELFIKSYLFGLILSSIYILNYFRVSLFINDINPFFKNYKIYLGIGVIVFLSCSFPMLYFWFSLTISGGAKGIFMKLLQTGNILLSLGYLTASIAHYLWTPQQK